MFQAEGTVRKSKDAGVAGTERARGNRVQVRCIGYGEADTDGVQIL